MKIIIAITVGALLGGLMGHFGKCASGACPLTSTPLRGALYGAFLGLMIGLMKTYGRTTQGGAVLLFL